MTGIGSTKGIRSLLPIAACVAALAGAACTSTDSSSPTAPSGSPSAPAPAATNGSVQISINPNPVPFSGQPIPLPGCASSPNTWFYDQILQETGGVAVTFTSRVDKFDGRVVNSLTGLNLAVPASNSLTIASRWCSSQAVAHTAQTTFTGSDSKGNAITVEGPVVNLRSP